MSERYFNDKGEVGYIVSPGYGAGWYSFNGDKFPDCATDPTLVQMVLDRKEWGDANRKTIGYSSLYYRNHPEIVRRTLEIEAYANLKWPTGYWSASDLCVSFAPIGHMVKYAEHDGYESVQVESPNAGVLLVL